MPSPILVLNSQTHYVADGSTTTWDFNFAGGYISKDHVKAYRIDPGTELIIPIPLAEPDIGEAQVSIIPAITDGSSLVIYRDTPKDMPLVDYTNGQGYDEASLDTTAKQAVFIAAEVLDRAGQALNVGGGVAELQELLLGGAGAGLVGYFNAVPYPANTVGSGIKSARNLADSAVDTAEAALAAVDAAVSSKANKAGDTFTGPVTVPELKLDTSSSLGVSAGSVNVLFDTGDGLVYNRATNTLDVNLGGSRMTVSAAAGPERTSDASTPDGLPRKSQMDAAILAALASLGTPGGIMYFAMSTPPTGWLKANGATISRTTYSALFAAIGTTYGAGDGSTTFKLPDLRGEFLRGWDDGRGVDTGRVSGSSQGDAIRNIVGEFAAVQTGSAASGVFTQAAGGQNGSDSGGDFRNFVRFDASRVVPTAPENRVRNVALMACIKY